MKRMQKWLSMMVLAFVFTIFAMPLFAQDSTAVGATAPVVNTSVALISLGAYALTKLIGKGAGKVEQGLSGVDTTVKSKIGPLLPVVAMGISILIPKLGLPGIDPISLVQAPATALGAVIINEAMDKWVLPFLRRKVGFP